MQDRYLCKAKGQTDNKWHIGFLTMLSGEVAKITDNEFLHTTWICDSSTLCRCTGLKDKNGKLIWENDIVRCVDKNSDIEFTARVEFGNPNGEYNWGWQLHHLSGDKPNLDILLWIETEESGAFCEVIGNIFDNPELLEV